MDVASLNLTFTFAWIWILLGLLSGVLLGLGFHREGFLGGYDSWPRRMLRLGHIAFFGTGMLNLLFALSLNAMELSGERAGGNGVDLVGLSQVLLIVGAVSMPVVCAVAAFVKPLRHLFVVPVVSLLGGVGLFVAVLITG